MADFVGRTKELTALSYQAQKSIASLIVVRGRRRIGKTRLIEEFGKTGTFYGFVGLVPTKHTTLQSELDNFSEQLSLILGIPGLKADNWHTLFLLLAQHTRKGRVIILFDEISWMGSKDPDFLGKLKNAWDLHLKKNPKLMLIICGSASAWIEKNILSSTAFLGRVSYTLTLEELLLSDANKFWNSKGCRLSAYEKLKMLAITGGVPRYLEEIQPTRPAEENIQKLCFERGGLLTTEFEKIFNDLFGSRSDKYREITKLLATQTLNYTEICAQLHTPKSSTISEYLNDLVVSGFISKDYTWDLKTGLSSPLQFKYRLRDNYLRFYLRYIEPRLDEIERNAYQFKTLSSLPGWHSIMGLQFENLVLNNRYFVHEKLGIKPEDIVIENPFFQRKNNRQKGCQIDYLIQTRNHVLFLCEIKFSKDRIDTQILTEIEEKINNLAIPRNRSVCPVLIHVNGVTDTVLDACYFHTIIDFTEILT